MNNNDVIRHGEMDNHCRRIFAAGCKLKACQPLAGGCSAAQTPGRRAHTARNPAGVPEHWLALRIGHPIRGAFLIHNSSLILSP